MKAVEQNTINAGQIRSRIKILSKIEGFSLHTLKFEKPLNSNIINKLESETGRLIDSDLKEFYKMLNGFSIDWSISNDQFDMNGSLHFFNIQQAFFGYKKINSENYESALEDVLWNEDGFEEKEIKKLKPHRVLESVAGDDAWYTYIPFTNNEKLYYICDGKIKTLKITRQAFINFRLLTMGLSVNTEKMNSKSNLSELLKMKDVVKFLNLLHSKS